MFLIPEIFPTNKIEIKAPKPNPILTESKFVKFGSDFELNLNCATLEQPINRSILVPNTSAINSLTSGFLIRIVLLKNFCKSLKKLKIISEKFK